MVSQEQQDEMDVQEALVPLAVMVHREELALLEQLVP